MIRNYLKNLQLLFLLIAFVFSSKNKKKPDNSKPNNLENSAQNEILMKAEEEKYTNRKYHYGVKWSKKKNKWFAKRTLGGKNVFGRYFLDVEQAKREADEMIYEYEMKTGQKQANHKLNFFAFKGGELVENMDVTHGVAWHTSRKKWQVQRWIGEKSMYGGLFISLEQARWKADEMVYEYEMKTGKKSKMKLNFSRREEIPSNFTQRNNKYGVFRYGISKKWYVHRMFDGKFMSNGSFVNLEDAKHASDDLVYQFENTTGKRCQHKLNFPRKEHFQSTTDDGETGDAEIGRIKKRKKE